MVFLGYCRAAYSNETSTFCVLFMNFFVTPREIWEIIKRGDQNKLGVSAKITKKK